MFSIKKNNYSNWSIGNELNNTDNIFISFKDKISGKPKQFNGKTELVNFKRHNTYTISDNLGKVKLFTNGINLYDKNSKLITLGGEIAPWNNIININSTLYNDENQNNSETQKNSGLFGDKMAHQGVVIIPKPLSKSELESGMLSNDKYFVVTSIGFNGLLGRSLGINLLEKVTNFCDVLNDNAQQNIGLSDDLRGIYENLNLNGDSLNNTLDFAYSYSSNLNSEFTSLSDLFTNSDKLKYFCRAKNRGERSAIHYSEVDTNLNSNDTEGEFVFINKPIGKNDNGYFKFADVIHYTLHANGNDYWLLAKGFGKDSDKLFSFLVTSDGIDERPTNIFLIPQVDDFFNSFLEGDYTDGFSQEEFDALLANLPEFNIYNTNAIAKLAINRTGDKISLAANSLSGSTIFNYNFDNKMGVVSDPLLVKSEGFTELLYGNYINFITTTPITEDLDLLFNNNNITIGTTFFQNDRSLYNSSNRTYQYDNTDKIIQYRLRYLKIQGNNTLPSVDSIQFKMFVIGNNNPLEISEPIKLENNISDFSLNGEYIYDIDTKDFYVDFSSKYGRDPMSIRFQPDSNNFRLNDQIYFKLNFFDISGNLIISGYDLEQVVFTVEEKQPNNHFPIYTSLDFSPNSNNLFYNTYFPEKKYYQTIVNLENDLKINDIERFFYFNRYVNSSFKKSPFTANSCNVIDLSNNLDINLAHTSHLNYGYTDVSLGVDDKIHFALEFSDTINFSTQFNGPVPLIPTSKLYSILNPNEKIIDGNTFILSFNGANNMTDSDFKMINLGVLQKNPNLFCPQIDVILPCFNCTNERNENFDVLSDLTDVRTRKNITNYAIARNIFDMYLIISQEKLNYSVLNKLSNKIGSEWIEIIEQFVPSTTIWEGNRVLRNSIFDQQKFRYKNYSLQLCGNFTGPEKNQEIEVILNEINKSKFCRSCKEKTTPICNLIRPYGINHENIFFGGKVIIS